MRQILIAAAVGLSVTLLGHRSRSACSDCGGGVSGSARTGRTHLEKMGTPTMGGTVIIAGIVAATSRPASCSRPSPPPGSRLLATVLLGLLGFMDDFIKVRRRRSLGLSKTAKIAGQAVIA